MGILAKRVTHCVLIIVLSVLVYASSIDVPFHFDDTPNIVENPIVKDFSYFIDTGRAAGLEKYDALRSRYIGYLTFFLNYRLHSLDVGGYHIVNILIHIINSLLVYALVLLSFRTPVLRESKLFDKGQWVALLAASLFAVHPLNTQAVTYIVQRLASLAALWYLGSMVCYIKARLMDGRDRWVYYTGALGLAVFAMKTKEIAFTLPAAITLYEFMFFRGEPLKKRALLLLPIVLTILIIPLTFTDLGKPVAEVMSDISEKMEIQQISRDTYLMTQVSVITTYLRLLLLPVNQNLDYDYPLYSSITQGPVLGALLLIMVLMGLAVYLFHSKEPTARLASFGIVFFFLALSVESSLVPLHPIFEHRTYLPGVGMMVAVSIGAIWLYEGLSSLQDMRGLVALCAASVLVFAVMTVERNTIWESDLSLWSDVVEKAPQNARGQYNLAIAYRDRGKIDKELSLYRRAIVLKPDYAEAHYNLAIRLSQLAQYKVAVSHYKMTISLLPDFSTAYYNLGVAYYLMGQYEESEKNYRSAQALESDNAGTYYALGVLYLDQGETDNAVFQLKKAVSLNGNNVNAHYKLGLAYLQKGMYAAAQEEIQATLTLNPQHHEAKALRDDLMK